MIVIFIARVLWLIKIVTITNFKKKNNQGYQYLFSIQWLFVWSAATQYLILHYLLCVRYHGKCIFIWHEAFPDSWFYKLSFCNRDIVHYSHCERGSLSSFMLNSIGPFADCYGWCDQSTLNVIWHDRGKWANLAELEPENPSDHMMLSFQIHWFSIITLQLHLGLRTNNTLQIKYQDVLW